MLRKKSITVDWFQKSIVAVMTMHGCHGSRVNLLWTAVVTV